MRLDKIQRVIDNCTTRLKEIEEEKAFLNCAIESVFLKDYQSGKTKTILIGSDSYDVMRRAIKKTLDTEEKYIKNIIKENKSKILEYVNNI